LSANLVPVTAVDAFQAQIAESLFHFCFNKFRVTLTAPAGTTDQVQIIDNGDVLATVTSSDQEPATATASKPSCFASGSVPVTIQVTDVTGQSAQDFQLVNSGSW
jgi:hypothetical protein